MIWWRAAILACALIAPPAAAEKVLRYAFPIAETGFDPVQINDLYSSIILGQIFDPPYTYDFLSRPPKVRPKFPLRMLVATSAPEVGAERWTRDQPASDRSRNSLSRLPRSITPWSSRIRL